MEQGVEKFDPSTLMQGVKDRIKATFVSLIPDGQWEVMVQKEIDSFFNEAQLITISEKKKVSSSGWNSDQYATKEVLQTPFRSLVWEMCYEKTIDIIKKKLNEEWFGNEWPITEDNIKTKMKEVVKEAAPSAMLKFFESLSVMYINQLRNDIQSHRV